jgi:hypothetical protein
LNGSLGASALPAGLRLLVGLTSTVDIRGLQGAGPAQGQSGAENPSIGSVLGRPQGERAAPSNAAQQNDIVGETVDINWSAEVIEEFEVEAGIELLRREKALP